MSILQKNNQGVFQSTGAVGEMGSWVDPKTGAGYSGPKRKPTDVPYQGEVGQSQNLNRNPNIPVIPKTTNPPVNLTENPPANNGLNTPLAQPTQPTGSPMDKFNLAILDMLQKAQSGAGDENLYLRQRQLQRKQIESGIDYSGTEGMSPQAQERIASARGGEYTNEIDAVGAKIKANDARLQNFERILGTMRQIGNDIKVKPSEEILQKYVSMIEAGGSLSSVPDEFQQDVIGKTNADTWRKQAQAIAKQKASEREPDKGPASYQEWILAGGQQGTGKTYAEWISGTKSLNVDQAKARQFAVAAENANNSLNTSKYELGWIENPWMPNVLKGSDRQTFERDARAFINAVLRRESGATITDDEFKNKYQELIPSAGDGPEVIAAKKTARELAVTSIKEAGLMNTAQTNSGSSNNIRVREKATGRTGTIPANEFDSNLYEEI